MNILHVVSGDLNGGAAKGALILHRALLKNKVQSTLVTQGANTYNDSFIISLKKNPIISSKLKLLKRIQKYRLWYYTNRKKSLFNTGYDGLDITSLPGYIESDIIHLHWINNLVSMKSLQKVGKPIVWTLRDMWPMTGGCHYSIDCSRYIFGCGACPQLSSICDNDLSRSVMNKKKVYLSNNITVVGISNWIKQCAENSYQFKNNDSRVIHNNIETDVFKPTEKNISKADLGFDLSERIVLVGALNVSDSYKGSKHLVEALKSIYKSNIHLVTFGSGVLEELKHLPIKQTDLGYVDDEKFLAKIYSAADVFVAPSLMDAFGKTLAEAQACGTPVVCFNATGPRDIVEHKVTGYKATPYEPSDLVSGISWVLSLDEGRYEEMCLESRQRSVRLFDSEKIAEEYEMLYKELAK